MVAVGHALGDGHWSLESARSTFAITWPVAKQSRQAPLASCSSNGSSRRATPRCVGDHLQVAALVVEHQLGGVGAPVLRSAR